MTSKSKGEVSMRRTACAGNRAIEKNRSDSETTVPAKAREDAGNTNPEVRTAFDIFGSDLPDEFFAEVFDQPRQRD
jgi:hypothetical protein